MIASLMMYARPELDGAHERYWALIRRALKDRDVQSPQDLANDADEFEVWTAPDLVLSQTCGMPYRKWLSDKVGLVGTPDYGVEGCPPGHYNSVIIVRTADPRNDLRAFQNACFTYNQTFSQSGYAAPYQMCQPLGFWFSDQKQSHAHRQSAISVAEGTADIAALDAVTWRFIQRYDAFAAKLRVLATTPPSPGLPYITRKDADRRLIFDAVREAIEALEAADQDALGLRGIEAIPTEDYLAVPNPPDDQPDLTRDAM